MLNGILTRLEKICLRVARSTPPDIPSGPECSYGSPGGVSQPPRYQVFLKIPRIPIDSYIFRWPPRWDFPASNLPGIPIDSQVFPYIPTYSYGCAGWFFPASKLPGIPIRHSATCEGVFSPLVALAGLFSVLLRAPRISFLGRDGVCRGLLFLVFFLCCFPSRPKRVQNR